MSTLALHRWTATGTIDSACALALSRQHPNDCRPELVLWHMAEADQYREIVVEYVARRITIFAARCGIRTTPDIVAYATLDAITLVRTRHCEISGAARALQLGVRRATYVDLRHAGERYLLEGIHAGLRRYLDFMRDRSTPAIRQSFQHDQSVYSNLARVAGHARHREAPRLDALAA